MAVQKHSDTVCKRKEEQERQEEQMAYRWVHAVVQVLVSLCPEEPRAQPRVWSWEAPAIESSRQEVHIGG